jgi:DNA-binding response OmpR family regulator
LLLFDPLAVTGTFLIGASAGALVTYSRCKPLLDRFREAPPASKASSPAQPKAHLGLKALIVGHDAEMISIFSAIFFEKSIEARKCFLESAAVDQLSSDKYEAIVLDFDEVQECTSILKNLPRPNEKALVIAVASDTEKKEAASRGGATLVVERPVTPARVRQLLRVAYGRMLRDGQQYFRLALELPVAIRNGAGRVLQCTTLNLSQTGMAVRSPSAFVVGEPVHLAFAIPNTDIFVTGEGKIIWDDKHGKTGISFECVNGSAQSGYYEWLHDHFFMRQSDDVLSHASEQMAHVG